MLTQENTESLLKSKKNFRVKLVHIEEVFVEAENEDDALRQAYREAEYNCFWEDCEVEILE